ncbi:unnamed protein product [Onchocerca flexuosa]|uniref:ZP domain-containing protein n=2 Tax=Onchocerca flexuosa TaxID=387005 RepID=A0A183HCC3_9BILA|nr:unnamed protein product [Onchocerca flexuosa]
MTVHSCFVEDGSGAQFVILNEDGCAIDRFLLDNLEYGPNELEAQKEAHAFKFADKVVVNFQCSVRLDIRDGECPKPQCRDLSNQRRAVRRRALPDLPLLLNLTDRMAEVDVRAQQLDVLDTQLDFGLSPNNPRMAAQIRRLQRPEGDCISTTTAVIGASFCATVLFAFLVHIVFLYRRIQFKR